MSTLAVDRRRAIAQSVGRGLPPVRPHNLAFWVYCVLVVAGAFVLSGQISIAAAAYSGALTSGIVAFGLLAVAYVWFIHYEDRYTTVPPKLAAAGFVWGFFAAIGAFALLANEAVIDLYAKAPGASFAYDWGAPRRAGRRGARQGRGPPAAPDPRAAARPEPVRRAHPRRVRRTRLPDQRGHQLRVDHGHRLRRRRRSLDDDRGPDARVDPVALDVHGDLRRWPRLVHRPPGRAGLQGVGAGLMLTAVLMHGLWNASSAIGGSSVFGWIVPLGVAATLISTFGWIYEKTQPIEREWMRELMAPEVVGGVVTPAELEALGGNAPTCRSYIRAHSRPRTAARVLEVETDLAHQIARDGGAETVAVQAARAAVAQARRLAAGAR